MLTQDYIQELFKYENGNLYWNIKRRGAPKNKSIGSKAKTGYLSCMIDGKSYLVHRIVFFYFYGYFPINVDHINGKRDDNRIENLRAVNKSENQQNIRKAFTSSTSQLLGAFYSKKHKNWFSRICVNGKRKWLGNFKTPNDAHQAYLNAKRNLHPTCTI